MAILGSLIFIRAYSQKQVLTRIQQFLKNHITGLVIIMALEMFGTVSLLNYSKQSVTGQNQCIVIVVTCGITYIVIGLLGATAIYMKHLQQKMEQMLNQEIILKKIQKQYYETLLEKEEDTRRYRHDMTNHLICLQSYCVEQDYNGLQKYLMHMTGEMDMIQNKTYSLGNSVLNANTGYYIAMLPKTTNVNIIGNVDERINIKQMDLCTIYANLLQNAVEAIGQQEQNAVAYLKIEFKWGEKHFQMNMSNSKVHSEYVQYEIPHTHKIDKKIMELD